ncbi:tripartite tricarboxylate transporter substrate binding protein [Bradyrhizobium lablabi]|uniref:tripartite tricarboxylate transporter substrate binding protein n=1 Tax=Bradyrhizobium lablabi TaxID=722472 RepID=UPI001BAB7A7E|nr:tripartite tricarboxylate transporter substrate binding protein [Bradyrhizobium lablabi]MBR1122505.1 tripartite tricarboxylate transporter substrate binding protein [Bradyrhizobium lablabi]
MFRHVRNFALAAFAAASLLGAGAAQAAFPERPITLIVPWAAGGGTDAVARQVALQLERDLKQPVNVVNRTGGSGVVGHQAIASAAPDGYTFGLITLEITLMHWVGLTDLTYEKYTPLALVNQDYAAIHVKSDSSFKNVKELFAHIKANPNKLTASGTGQGGSWHVALAGLMQADGVSPGTIRWVPSTGAATALTDLAAGGIDFVSCSMPEAEALLKAGRIRSLVFFSPKRAPNFPDVPTTEEATGHKWHKGVWRGFAAPKGLPPEIAKQYETAIKKVWDSDEFKEFMTRRGFDVIWMDGAKYGEFMKADDKDNGEALKSLGLAK